MSAKILLMTFILTMTALAQTSQWRLIWDKNLAIDTVLYYNIYRGLDDSTPNFIGTTEHIKRTEDPGESVDTTDTDIPAKGKLIYYRVSAVNIHGESEKSEPASDAIPLLDFPYDFYLPPSKTIDIPLRDRVIDPTTDINAFKWDFGFPSGFDTSIVDIDGSPFLSLSTPGSWSEGGLVIIRATNSSEFYDSTAVRIYADSLLVDDKDLSKHVNGYPYASIHWKTKIPTRGRIGYGISTADDQYSEYTQLDTIHNQRTNDLNWIQTYLYKIESVDYYEIFTHTKNDTFSTPDSSVVPITFQLGDLSVRCNEAVIPFTTSDLSMNYIRFGLDTTLALRSGEETILETTHSISLPVLQENSTYYYRIFAKSKNNISYQSNIYTFSTPECIFNVYPIPLELSNPLHNKRIIFEGIPIDGSLHIFNLLGDPVYKKLNIQDNPFYWNAVNNADRRVHTGVYLYLIKSPSGKIFAEGKVIVIY